MAAKNQLRSLSVSIFAGYSYRFRKNIEVARRLVNFGGYVWLRAAIDA
jgi:hypothetical protein